MIDKKENINQSQNKKVKPKKIYNLFGNMKTHKFRSN